MLKQLLLTRSIAAKRAELDKLNETKFELEQKREAMKAREAELEAAVNEVTEETSEEDRAEVDAAVAEFEAQEAEQDRAETENGEAIVNLQNEIDGLQRELDELNARAAAPVKNTAGNTRKEGKNMIRKFFGLDAEQIRSFLADENVISFLGEVRSAIREKRALNNAGLTIPDNMLGLVREEVARQSKLLPFVNHRRVTGTGRMNIMGKIPEAVWTEMCANINELDLVFNQTEVDGYKVGAFVAICNATLEDSDLALAQEIVDAIGIAIAKALDKAILFGTGSKMPVGIATRLAASSQPAWWGTNDPAFTDLHTSNVQTINVNASSGAAFFIALVAKLAIAKPKYSGDGLFWAMNRKTHLDIMAKALAVNANGAYVANTQLMPVVGGEIVEFEDDQLADYEIIGGFGANYLMAERAGVELASSSEVRFLQDQTVFKGTGRYDGRPLAGEAFVIVNYNNTSPTTSKSFPTDWANEEMNTLGITAAASASNVGKTVLTVADTVAAENPELYYKVGKVAFEVGDDQPASGFNSLTSGTTEITAAAGKIITVIEVNSDDKVVSVGYVASVPKAS